MKTFEEHMQEAVGATYPIDIILNNLETDDIVEEVNNYAKDVAREALKSASLVGNALREDGDLVKKIILNECNIPVL